MVVEKYTRNVSHTVRLLGFDAAERSHLDALLMQCPAGGPRYTCLSEDSLHEPDLYIADGDGPAGLAALTRANPGPVQPAMVVARTPAPLPFPRIVRRSTGPSCTRYWPKWFAGGRKRWRCCAMATVPC